MTQYQKCLAIMSKEDRRHLWFTPPDFMQPELGDLFVGYKAGVRLAELSKKYPGLFKQKQAGKYIARTIDWVNINNWYWLLPLHLQRTIKQYYGAPVKQEAML